MFKRFLVMDVLFGNKDFDDIKEWVDVKKELPNERNGIFKVKLYNGNTFLAYFCMDKVMCLTGNQGSHWYKKGTGAPLFDVTHWAKGNE